MPALVGLDRLRLNGKQLEGIDWFNGRDSAAVDTRSHAIPVCQWLRPWMSSLSNWSNT